MIHRYAISEFRHVVPHGLRSIGERSCRATLSSGQPGLDNLILVPSGIDFSRYNKILLWAHDQLQPIGRCIPQLTGGVLEGGLYFEEPGVSDVADRVFAMVRSGTLSACSIGFEIDEVEPYDRRTGVRRVTRSRLLETSIVSIGADPGAIVTSRGYNYFARQGDLRALRQAARDGLKLPCRPVLSGSSYGEAGLWARKMADYRAARLGMRRLGK
jgi:HK97 family phage prohead protease